MATGGFKPNATTDFLEEWKAKREKMRAKMLGEIAAVSGAPLATSAANSSGRHAAPPAAAELPAGPERSANCLPPSYPLARSSSGTALKEETHHAGAPAGSNPKKAPSQPERAQCGSPDPSSAGAHDMDQESPSPSKAKEKNSSGPSARKGKGQIEKRKLREKRRSTGVVSIPSNESLDELDDDDPGEKERREEEALVQANTYQNEAMTADTNSGHLLDTPRSGSGRHKSSVGTEEEVGGNRQRHNRHARDPAPGSLERRIDELEKELARERQENFRLLKAHQDKDDLIGKLKEEVDLLNRDLDDIEDENEQLKQENKTLLKVVGQLTR